MSNESRTTVTMDETGLLAVTFSIVVVTVALAMLLRENGSYSLEELALLGGLGVAIVGLLLMVADRLL